MSEKYQDYTDIPKPQASGEEIVQQKKTRIMDTVAKIVTLLIAFLFWFYVFATNDATKVEEMKFELIPIEIRGGETIASRDLAVQNMSFFNIDVTLKGTRGALSGVTSDDIKAYINISDITGPGVYYRTLYYDIPTGLSDAPMGTRMVEITVDTIAEKSFSLDYSNVVIDTFVLPASCEIDYENIVLNVASLTLEGPTMVLDRIENIKILSRESLTLEGSTTLTAAVEALDAAGDVVNISSCKVVMLTKSGVILSTLTVTVPIYQTKTLPVVIYDKDGLTDKDVSVFPASVTVRGTPEEMNDMTSFTLDSFSVQTLLAGEDGTASFQVSLPKAYQAYTVTDADGNAIDSFTVTVALSEEKTLTFPASCIKTVGGTVGIVSESVAITFRATDGNEDLLTQLLLAAEKGEDVVSLVADVDGIKLTGEQEVKLMIVLLGEYKTKIYEVLAEGKPYTVTVKPIS